MAIHALWSEVTLWLGQVQIPDPPPKVPGAQLEKATNYALGIMKWGGIVGAVGSLIAAGIMMAIGRRNRNNMAIEGVIGIPWVIGGMAVVFGAATLVGFFFQG
ncbi:hypothetical protein [Amycolatopsis tolypomycina]|uniref:hypothetical protein n=1 Tax=Amycolatopsis tolypomycina TaxID=208445 RepID=UPI0033A6206C